MSDTPEYGSVCQACGHINGAHLRDCRIAELERALAAVTHTSQLNQGALDRASFELQRHFGREGSIYGIKACEEIARIAIVAYQDSRDD